jgi:hypothetical protein
VTQPFSLDSYFTSLVDALSKYFDLCMRKYVCQLNHV